ncbi:MAG: SDR family oxidoreductase [Treponema sp.]|jgi:NAD(P)-dependent dehydrogenase (short-subunit alcohol dehydrogenase family)|nr:SDR family oxidoreductase [Treponema sp.]
MIKNAFVTGGSRGIGAGIVQVLSDSGYDVAFTYNEKADSAEALKKELEAKGRRCFYYQASLQHAEVPQKVTEQAIKDLGGIDLLVCNAGLTRHNDILNLDPALIDFLFGLNFRSYLLCSKVAANNMVARGVKGNIIFITSTRGIRAYPEDTLYGGLKAALNRAAESMALNLAKYHIRVNCVAPGATAIRGSYSPEELSQGSFAPHIPLGRLGSPREVGYLVRYIASDEADYMTGNVIKLDGGLILPGMPEWGDLWPLPGK